MHILIADLNKFAILDQLWYDSIAGILPDIKAFEGVTCLSSHEIRFEPLWSQFEV